MRKRVWIPIYRKCNKSVGFIYGSVQIKHFQWGLWWAAGSVHLISNLRGQMKAAWQQHFQEESDGSSVTGASHHANIFILTIYWAWLRVRVQKLFILPHLPISSSLGQVESPKDRQTPRNSYNLIHLLVGESWRFFLISGSTDYPAATHKKQRTWLLWKKHLKGK